MRGSHRQTCRPKCSIWALRHGRQRRLLKKICPIGRHLTNQGRGGGVFLRKILSTFVLLSVLIKKGNGHFLSLWSMHGSAVHGPACDILYDICNTMTESSTRRLKLLTLNFYNMSNRKNYAAPEMQSFEVNAEAGFAVSPIDAPSYGGGGSW